MLMAVLFITAKEWNKPNVYQQEKITNCGIFIQWNTTPQLKGMKNMDTQHNGETLDESKSIRSTKEADKTRSIHCISPYLKF